MDRPVQQNELAGINQGPCVASCTWNIEFKVYRIAGK